MVPLDRSEPLSTAHTVLRAVSRIGGCPESPIPPRIVGRRFGKRAASVARWFGPLRRRAGRAGNLGRHGGRGETDLRGHPVIGPGAAKIPGIGLPRGLEGLLGHMDRPRCALSRGESPSCRVAARRRMLPGNVCPVRVGSSGHTLADGLRQAAFARASGEQGTGRKQEGGDPRGDHPGNRWGTRPRAKGRSGKFGETGSITRRHPRSLPARVKDGSSTKHGRSWRGVMGPQGRHLAFNIPCRDARINPDGGSGPAARRKMRLPGRPLIDPKDEGDGKGFVPLRGLGEWDGPGKTTPYRGRGYDLKQGSGACPRERWPGGLWHPIGQKSRGCVFEEAIFG